VTLLLVLLMPLLSEQVVDPTGTLIDN